ncbi:Crp/Fnr family transcriptional regulator [Vibrio vulnificus]|uniref:Crp/Fnr family transcriptional regulator n=1 Tax=Vibrio vulnificus TaxID=672 RepID=UPI000934AB03|nr:Crp/Fnr family transcriptional regulator [Vibrio vulnificus]EGQ9880147.1 Crp/Fnr family transcriptional regulator [Vibrio vulnificus]EGR1423586.1 Crp/Fnr family transcriptional regulator [Vibrio vulnificus]EHU4942551.1 Crp/Fnr family transcriptional regulator [Vibrio vulnificus]EHU5197678.1 Crp/Fnr family transcriptional regulator [Vibrio vulnificus]EHU9472150.1 Crp/Fnr family transcriptional regulator [Vibrio vulnificus]
MRSKVDESAIRWTTQLSSHLTQNLASIAQRKALKGSQLNNSNLLNQGVNFLEQGTLAVCIQTPNLKTANCLVIGTGGWFGNYSDNRTSLSSFIFIEIEPCRVINFDNTSLRQLAKSHDEIYKWFYSLTFESRDKWLQSQLINSESILVRVVYQLIEILVHKGIKTEPLSLAISQQQLSEMTGIARQRVNEVLKRLERENSIKLNRVEILILDLPQLFLHLDGIDLSLRDPRNFI